MKILFGLLVMLIVHAKCEAQSIKVGSKVEIQWSNGYWYPATIVDESDAQYKVHLNGDGDTNARDQWINKDKGIIRSVKNNTTTKPLIQAQVPGDANNDQRTKTTTTNAKAAKIPEMNGAIPKLPGTAWLLVSIIPKGKTPEYLPSNLPYLFLANGRWETQFIGQVVMGNYQVQGNKLVQTRDGIDGFKWVSTLKWNAADNYLDLEQNDVVYRLHYNMKISN